MITVSPPRWMIVCLLTFLVALPVCSFDLPLTELAENQQFLTAEQAFSLSTSRQHGRLSVSFVVAPGHYLYRDKLSIEAVDPSRTTVTAPTFPDGLNRYDPVTEKQREVYTGEFTVSVTVNSKDPHADIEIHYQGCSEAGLCYPPVQKRVTVQSLPTSPDRTDLKANNADDNVNAADPLLSARSDDFLAELLSGRNLAQLFLIFFLAGLALSLTPCVLPMVPVLSAVVVDSSRSRSHAAVLTCSFVLAMALTYAVAGVLIGSFGAALNLQARLQSPWLLIPFAGLFVGLALSLFGLYELQLPERLRNLLSRADRSSSSQHRGRWWGAALMGVFSALLMSPCVSAPLVGVLAYIGTTGNTLVGGLALFAIGLGMGIPLLLVGIGGGALLPRAGRWMEGIKLLFGVLLLFVALSLVERLLVQSAILLLWGGACVVGSICLGGLDFRVRQGWALLQQAVAFLLLVYGLALAAGGLAGHTRLQQPLAPPSVVRADVAPSSSGRALFERVTDSRTLEQRLQTARQQQQVAVLYVSAKWCSACRELERNALSDPEVVQALHETVRVKLDITDSSADQQRLLSRYDIFGPPALLFFDTEGNWIKNLSWQGTLSSEQLLARIDAAGKQGSASHKNSLK